MLLNNSFRGSAGIIYYGNYVQIAIKSDRTSDTEGFMIYNTFAVEGTIGLIFLLDRFVLHPSLYANRLTVLPRSRIYLPFNKTCIRPF